jgi:uncharacterized protein with NAD-binding domain and iron-sulfur cluster
MAGLAAAWRLSEPGWRDRFASITIHQRGWRLGGKGASSRGRAGRIEEHGLHLWLGFYENAFRLLRECYAELDRPATDPAAPIRTWREALWPTSLIGLEDRHDDGWEHWLARFATDDREPGEPLGARLPPTLAGYVQRAVRLILEFVDALPDPPGAPPRDVVLSGSAVPPPAPVVGTLAAGARVLAPAAVLEAARLLRAAAQTDGEPDAARSPLVRALDRLHDELGAVVDADPALRRSWQHVSLSIALVRGLVADGVLADPRRLRRLDDDDFLEWIARHGAARDAVDGAFLRGMYDLVFAYEEGDPSRPRFAAGTAVLITLKMLLDYRGGVFWKMAAGMGDVVFAPLYQSLRARGVEIEFFSRIDGLHLDADRRRIASVSLGRQARLRPGLDRYDPLVRVGGLPCFRAAPDVGQLADADGIASHPLEAHWCTWPDAERRELRDGRDYDVVVLAIPVGMAGAVCAELVADRPEWAEMVGHLGTVATQALQLWLRDDERALGWPVPGATVSGFTTPFDTWASLPHLLDVERWRGPDRPRTVAYFCSVLDTPGWRPVAGTGGPTPRDTAEAAGFRDRVRANAVRFLERDIGHLLPGAVEDGGFRWELLCGRGRRTGDGALDSQFWAANVDASDRYVQSLPGTGRYRLRPDESGYDNLVLAGDWTDSGLNAGCIEAATVSGLQAANAVLGRARNHRLTPYDIA